MRPRELKRYAAACLRAALLDADAFAAARRCLQQQAIERGGDGLLRDVEAALAEDYQTIVLYAEWASDDPLTASFRLVNRIEDEDDFDAEWYRDLLQRPCERPT
jgi:hypothetical protein